MFGISFSELLVVVVVGLIVLGPQKLPGLLRTLGEWVGRLRRLTTEVRAQSGIDELLRAEGLSGGLSELRGLIRHDHFARPKFDVPADTVASAADPYHSSFEYDTSRERPSEGPDSYGAIAEDLIDSTHDGVGTT